MTIEQGLKQWSTLKSHAQAVSQRYPTDAESLVFLARAYNKLNNKDLADKTYQKLLQRVPGHHEALYFLE